MKRLTHERMREEIFKFIIQKHGSQKAAAEHWGVSPSFVSQVVTGGKFPNAAMLRDIGLIPITLFERVISGKDIAQ